jgi:nucleoside-diphosphate-sugar epimerase
MVSINQLVDLAEELAGIKLKRNYKRDAPKGVRGRSSDNTFLRRQLQWEPSTPLQTGLEKTYAWIFDQMKRGRSSARIVNRF